MAEEIELLEVQNIPVEEGAGIDADNAEDAVIDFSWLSSMEEKLASASGPNSSPSFTICQVPAKIRKCDDAAYNPQIVSIGPLHRGSPNLRDMEKHKFRCLQKVLALGEGRNNLEKFIEKMMEVETQARNCYPENSRMSSEEFVEMMLLDGCLIIFLILQQIGLVETDVLGYGNRWMPRLIKLDMLLLENQLPFFVLECLWELIGQPKDRLRNEALKSFGCLFSYELELNSPDEHFIHHLLHLLHLSFQPVSPSRESQSTSASGKLSSIRLCQYIGKTLRFLCPAYLINTYHRFRTPSQQSSPESQSWNMIPSATELQEAGVRFRLKQARSFLEVRFEQGLMEMPGLSIYEDTCILFRNFMAFEQCFPLWGTHCTSYSYFIDFLVKTPRDKSILMEAGIIKNGSGSNEKGAFPMSNIFKEIVWEVGNNNLADLFDKVNQHTKRRWPRWWAKFKLDYFRNPWASISLKGGVIVLILTFLQTYFSVYAYFKPPKQP